MARATKGRYVEREAFLGLETLTPCLAHALDALEIDLVGDEGVRRGGLGPHHVLSRATPHVGEGHDLVPGGPERGHGDRGRLWCPGDRRRGRGLHGWCCRRSTRWSSRGGGSRGRRARGTTRLDDALSIVPGDAAARAGAGHLGLADAVFGQEFAHHGRQDVRSRSVPVARRTGCGRRSRRRSRRGRRRRRRRRSGSGLLWCGSSRCRCGRRRCGLGRCCDRCVVGRCGPGTVADHRQLHADLDRLAFGDEDLAEHARGRRGHLGVDLVGRDLEERLVPLDRVADCFHPARDRSFGHRLAELRHHHVSQRAVPFRSTRAWSHRMSRTTRGAAE